MNYILNRITLNKEIRSGKPTIRNMRFTVTELLELMSSGMTAKQILLDYPFLEKEDIDACLLYASKLTDTKSYELLAQ
ncbi:MAG: DUF433 domain-containing protein [Ignavibacteria bacterium]|nr:DUF433 domain-containing protein [Ignavibacteria bacterium]